MSAEELRSAVLSGPMPKHIAIIMDGNGRWAHARKLGRYQGHRAGVDALRRIMRAGARLEIPILTVYAFSTENWKRPQEEVRALMNLLVEYVDTDSEELLSQDISVNVIGHPEELPLAARQAVHQVCRRTRGRSRRLNVALNYGGRREIIDACRELAAAVHKGELAPEAISEEMFARHLYTAGQPDPDLLIRPSGEMRISNFLLWQLAYTELYVTPVLWPDFDAKHLYEAILAYQSRDRRYGGLSKGQAEDSLC